MSLLHKLTGPACHPVTELVERNRWNESECDMGELYMDLELDAFREAGESAWSGPKLELELLAYAVGRVGWGTFTANLLQSNA
jgi:hypothetical protein